MTEEKLKNSIEIRSEIKRIQKIVITLESDIRDAQRKLGMLYIDDSESEKIEKGEYILAHLAADNIGFNSNPELFRVVEANKYGLVREFLV